MKTKKIVYYGVLTSLGIALHILEGMIPNPFVGIVPGAKIGLANIIALISLKLLGLKFAMAVNLMRVLIAGLLTGAVTSMLYGFAGAFFSTLAMWVALYFFSNYFSLIGVSLLGALAHNIAQLSVASLIIQNPRIFIYLPVMMFSSIFTGFFIGLAAFFVLEKISFHFKDTSYNII
ncbi:heptaprenyl diphosphate synthase [Tindallia magadiensis]|uniref:Heptaprenyl diphosphate synthase n=1 Tax=Tindallia magadiensis TaxID=69895 RepID=A0A1I3A7M8_9FIRM|nr:Gx transporter family protein [Tindallia magadiensis]SFH45920.1 heptaprenyl diphosphate synthase [Tindallia magadiensis]